MEKVWEYEMRIGGGIKACQLFAATLPYYDRREIQFWSRNPEENLCVLEVKGDCLGRVEEVLIYRTGTMPAEIPLHRIPERPEADIEPWVEKEIMEAFWDVNLAEKAHVFHCEAELSAHCQATGEEAFFRIGSGKVFPMETPCFSLGGAVPTDESYGKPPAMGEEPLTDMDFGEPPADMEAFLQYRNCPHCGRVIFPVEEELAAGQAKCDFCGREFPVGFQ